jgi:formyltetrahydrofolate hydrolase
MVIALNKKIGHWLSTILLTNTTTELDITVSIITANFKKPTVIAHHYQFFAKTGSDRTNRQ